MRFRKGDIVYCISPVNSNNPNVKNLEKNKPYIVESVFSNDKFEESIKIKEFGIKLKGYRFITIQELRSRKINKIQQKWKS